MRAAIIQREPAKLVRDALLSFHAAKLVLSVTGMSWLAMIGLGLTTILLVRKNLERPGGKTWISIRGVQSLDLEFDGKITIAVTSEEPNQVVGAFKPQPTDDEINSLKRL